jgi:hypothetical protein
MIAFFRAANLDTSDYDKEEVIAAMSSSVKVMAGLLTTNDSRSLGSNEPNDHSVDDFSDLKPAAQGENPDSTVVGFVSCAIAGLSQVYRSRGPSWG